MSTETILGRCIGVPGLPLCGKQIMADDIEAIELEGNRGFMCGDCQDRQLAPVSQKPQGAKGAFIGGKRKGGKASAKREAARPHVRPGFSFPGSKDFTAEDRKLRKQPWGMEGK